MLCTVTVDVDNTDGVIAFLNCINDLSYIDIKSIDVKGKSDGNDINLYNPCTNYGCEFQSGIVRTKCAFYMPPTEEAITKDQYEAKLKADMVAMRLRGRKQ